MSSSQQQQVAVLETDLTDDSNPNNVLTVPSADVVRLIEAFLTEAGLHQTCDVLQQESGVGLAGAVGANTAHCWRTWAAAGQWAQVLKQLSRIDARRARLDPNLLAAVHEQTILELADAGDLQLAYATYRLVQSDLQQSPAEEQPKELLALMGSTLERGASKEVSRARILEQRLAALASARSKDATAKVTADFYGTDTTRQQRRDEIGRRLQEALPRQPMGRLNSLLQQALKWQAHTGQLSRIRPWWHDDEDADEEQVPEQEEDGGEKKKRKRQKKEFDLVLGEISVDPVGVSNQGRRGAAALLPAEPVVSDPYATIKLGKKTTAESALFLPASAGLVTGSSDGLIEIWDEARGFQDLRLDLPYQKKEELMGHDDGSSVTALAVSNDGQLLASGSSNGVVKVWRIDTGKCLREIAAHPNSSVSCLCFSPGDGSHILTASHDGTCREFGLRTSRMLKEFRGQGSFVNTCAYYRAEKGESSDELDTTVVTGSADGTVRLYDGKTSDVQRVFRPMSQGKSATRPGSSIAVDHQHSDFSADAGSPSVHTVLLLHTPPQAMIIVPRGVRAFLVNRHGEVLRVYQDDSSVSSGSAFVAATTTPSNRYLYAVREDGVCSVFDVVSGELKTAISDFGKESTSRVKDGNKAAAELTALVHHPTKSIVGAFSNDKGQKRGQVMLWKK